MPQANQNPLGCNEAQIRNGLNRRRRVRRRFITGLLVTAAWLVFCGLTWLEPYLSGIKFILYWCMTFGFTLAAFLGAMRDAVLSALEAARNQPRKAPVFSTGENSNNSLHSAADRRSSGQ
jgi:hypothetical protein